jgi:hypothetical protein
MKDTTLVLLQYPIGCVEEKNESYFMFRVMASSFPSSASSNKQIKEAATLLEPLPFA